VVKEILCPVWNLSQSQSVSQLEKKLECRIIVEHHPLQKGEETIFFGFSSQFHFNFSSPTRFILYIVIIENNNVIKSPS
jgi:hypothetical protein